MCMGQSAGKTPPITSPFMTCSTIRPDPHRYSHFDISGQCGWRYDLAGGPTSFTAAWHVSGILDLRAVACAELSEPRGPASVLWAGGPAERPPAKATSKVRAERYRTVQVLWHRRRASATC